VKLHNSVKLSNIYLPFLDVMYVCLFITVSVCT